MDQGFNTITSRAIPFGCENVNTDIIIGARWLKSVSREGLGRGAFESVRINADSIFDDPDFAGAAILIAGDNFGCGSSREHAVWAIVDMGISAVIAPSFSDIFSSNAFKNGLLTIELPREVIDQLMVAARTGCLTIDLEHQVVTTLSEYCFSFEIDPFRKKRLIEGLDEIGAALERCEQIDAYEKHQETCRPWMFLPAQV